MGDLLVVHVFELEKSQLESLVGHNALNLDVQVLVVKHCVHALLDKVLQPFFVVFLVGDLDFNLLVQVWHDLLNLISSVDVEVLQELQYLEPSLLTHNI